MESFRLGRERKQVVSFWEEQRAAERRTEELKRQKKEAEEERKRKQAEEEGPIVSRFERAKHIKHLVEEEENLIHSNKIREGRYHIKQDMEKSTALQWQFLADHFDLVHEFLPQKVVTKLKSLDRKPIPFKIHPYMDTTPPYIKGSLRDYQLLGLNWMLTLYHAGTNGILADEMGLGKTLQTISFLATLANEFDAHGPHMIVCPLSVLGTWMGEFAKWAPNLRVVQFYGNQVQREAQRETCMREHFDVCVTTYETLVSEESSLSHRLFRYVILDEAQRIKSTESRTAQAVRRIPCQHRLILTGTPLQNNVHELWALLNFLFPQQFTSSEAFDECFDLDKNVIDVKMLQKVHQLLKPIMLRRLKTDVALEMPPKIETKILVPLSAMQKFWYRRLITKEGATLEGGDKAEWAKLLCLLMQLRKCCNHPYMFEDALPNPYNVGPEIVEASGKLRVLDKLLPKLQAQGSKVLLFSGFTSMLDVLEDYCEFRKYKFLRLDGSRSRIQREVDMKGFQDPNSEFFLFLISTRAGGLGLNLPAADVVVLYDSDWNPQVDAQAQARSHRLGQKKTVRVYRLVTQGSAEQRLVQRAEKKLFLDAVVMEKDTDAVVGQMDRTELLETIKFGCGNIFRGKGDITDEDVDLIVDATLRSDSNVEVNGNGHVNGTNEEVKLEVNAQHNVSEFNAEEEFVSIRSLDGEVIEKHDTMKDIGNEWLTHQTAKRDRSTTMVEVTDSFQFPGQKILVKKKDVDILTNRLVAKAPTKPQKKKERLTEEVCWICKDGGDLVICSYCPKVYHAECLREPVDESRSSWSCPQHTCVKCDATTTESGGVLFRCHSCPLTWCYKDCPPDCEILYDGCPKMKEMEYAPRNIVWMKCCSCISEQKTGKRLLEVDVWARRLEADYDDQEVETVQDKRWNNHHGKNRGIQYLVKYKNYGPKYINWVKKEDLKEHNWPLFDAFDAQWMDSIDQKEKWVKEQWEKRQKTARMPWEGITKTEKATKRAANKRKKDEEAASKPAVVKNCKVPVRRSARTASKAVAEAKGISADFAVHKQKDPQEFTLPTQQEQQVMARLVRTERPKRACKLTDKARAQSYQEDEDEDSPPHKKQALDEDSSDESA